MTGPACLCWRDRSGATRRALMSRRAAARFAAVFTAIFPQWPCWTEAAPDARRRRMADVTAALSCIPDDPDGPPHRRLATIADQIAGMLNAGELDALPDDTRAALAALPLCLLDIAGRLTPGRGAAGGGR